MAREERLIEQVLRRFPFTRDGLRVGIGDDAAVLRPSAGTEWVVTTDPFLEAVHFLRKIHPAEIVGSKALARATSDIAAMGARARYFFLTLGLPEECTGAWLDEFLRGMARAAKRFGLTLAGGDTTKYSQIVISLTVMGEIDRGKSILRSGAKPGDLLFVSGRLGEAELGWRLMQRKLHKQARWGALLKKHLSPEPRLALGQWLADHRGATSMIDTSDGLSTDLGHICKASGVGARVLVEKIPAVRVPSELRHRSLDPLQLALHGGEDYELLFTVSKRFAGHLPRKVAGIPVTHIGEITRQKKVVLVGTDGGSNLLLPGGWDPFLRSR
jgi:thiamine-monophosphate kinase